MEKKIRWGIVGLGNIAHQFAADMKLVPNAILTSVASRNLQKANEFAKMHNDANSFGNYEELFDCDEVDVVYIATPHNSHAELSMAAMNKGKHVLCEKPLATNYKDAQRIFQCAADNKVFIMEALWSRFNPSIERLLAHVEKGDIGKVVYLHADFAFYGLDSSEEGRLLNPNLAGGSLLDIGIYPIFLAYLIFGKPEKILATSNFYKTGVEIQTSMIFSYPDAQAILYSGLNSKSEMKAEISGTKGSLFLDPRWHEPQGYTLQQNDHTEHFNMPTLGKGYTYEIDEVNKCINSGRLESEKWNHQSSLDLLEILDEVRSQGKIVFPFET